MEAFDIIAGLCSIFGLGLAAALALRDRSRREADRRRSRPGVLLKTERTLTDQDKKSRTMYYWFRL